ncbi:MAG: DNA recombination protein RmuC [Actinomycetota bacterium]
MGALLVVLTRRTASPDLAGAVQQATAQAVADALVSLNEQLIKGQASVQETAASLVATMGAQEFGKHAKAIDTRLDTVVGNLTTRLGELGTEIGQLRERNAQQYAGVAEAVSMLSANTKNLNDILSNSQRRGQWGERLAEDMLRAAGLKLGINYRKQSTNESGSRPDYTFLMPPNRVLLMDVKFPLDKYVEYVNATSDTERDSAKKDFLRAVTGHVSTLAKRDYVDKATDNTIDYVLMFVPNEGISGFVHEVSPDLIDQALAQKVILCSPLTLYAFLVVIRQAAESFHTERTAADVMRLINLFNKQWEEYTKAVEGVSKSFHKLQDDMESISTGGTRYNKLNVQVKAIEKMRKQQGVPELTVGESADAIFDD